MSKCNGYCEKDWPIIGLELATRAAIYSHHQIKIENNVTDGIHEYRDWFVADVDVTVNNSQLIDIPWWWVIIPLLKELLCIREDSQSFATKVTLGKYSWSYEARKREIKWSNFLSDGYPLVGGFSLKEQVEFLHRSVDQGDILPTSLLADIINRMDEITPCMRPILVDFSVNGNVRTTEHLIVLQLKESWSKLNTMYERDWANTSSTEPDYSGVLKSYVQAPSLLGIVKQPVIEMLSNIAWYEGNENQEKIVERVSQFLLWLHWGACMEDENVGAILTVPPPLVIDSLPGTHVGAIVVYIRKDQWISKQDLDKGTVINKIASFSAAFRSGAMVKVYKEVEEYKNKIDAFERQSRVLSMLRAPLNSLTEALIKTQHETYTLQSILYSSHKSLFTVAKSIEEYFDQNLWSSYGAVHWKGIHGSGQILKISEAKDIDLQKNLNHSAAVAIAAIICRIFGAEPRYDDDENNIYWRVVMWLDTDDPVFLPHKRLLDILLFGDSGKKSFLEELKDAMLGVHLRDIVEIKRAYKSLKACLFTPFKFKGKTPITPLALILFDYNYDNSLYSLNDRQLSPKDILLAGVVDNVFIEGSLPVPRYSDFLDFLSGIISYAMSEKAAKVSSACVNSTDDADLIEIIFDKPIFIMNELENVFDLMIYTAREKLFSTQGNFRKPLLKFASVLYMNKKKDNITHENNCLTVKHPPYTTSITFEENKFTFRIFENN